MRITDILPVPGATPMPCADWHELLHDVATTHDDALLSPLDIKRGHGTVTARDVRALADWIAAGMPGVHPGTTTPPE